MKFKVALLGLSLCALYNHAYADVFSGIDDALARGKMAIHTNHLYMNNEEDIVSELGASYTNTSHVIRALFIKDGDRYRSQLIQYAEMPESHFNNDDSAAVASITGTVKSDWLRPDDIENNVMAREAVIQHYECLRVFMSRRHDDWLRRTKPGSTILINGKIGATASVDSSGSVTVSSHGFSDLYFSSMEQLLEKKIRSLHSEYSDDFNASRRREIANLHLRFLGRKRSFEYDVRAADIERRLIILYELLGGDPQIAYQHINENAPTHGTIVYVVHSEGTLSNPVYTNITLFTHGTAIPWLARSAARYLHIVYADENAKTIMDEIDSTFDNDEKISIIENNKIINRLTIVLGQLEDNRDPIAMRYLADIELLNGNKYRFYQLMNRAAEGGLSYAQHVVRALYSHGIIVNQDRLKAAEWSIRAINNNALGFTLDTSTADVLLNPALDYYRVVNEIKEFAPGRYTNMKSYERYMDELRDELTQHKKQLARNAPMIMRRLAQLRYIIANSKDDGRIKSATRVANQYYEALELIRDIYPVYSIPETEIKPELSIADIAAFSAPDYAEHREVLSMMKEVRLRYQQYDDLLDHDLYQRLRERSLRVR
jgi:hypothetical protein